MYTQTRAIRERKRSEAKKRQSQYNDLTLEQKLASAKGRKQRAKLESQIAASKKGAAK